MTFYDTLNVQEETQKKLFGLPEQIIPHSIIALGYPAEEITAQRESRYEEDRVHWNRWSFQ